MKKFSSVGKKSRKLVFNFATPTTAATNWMFQEVFGYVVN